MRSPTSEQIDDYRRDGFVWIEGFFDDDELAAWRRATDDAVAERHANAEQHGDAYYRRVFTQLQRLADTHDGMAELILDPVLGEIAATLAGIPGRSHLARPGPDQTALRQPNSWHLDDRFGRSARVTRSRSGSRSTTRGSRTAASGTCRSPRPAGAMARRIEMGARP